MRVSPSPWILTYALVLAMGSSTRDAGAQDIAVAEALFREGHRQLAEGHVHEACLKFADSQRLDPGIGALLNLALCHEREGKMATAWAEFSEVASLAARAGQGERQRFAEQKVRELETKMPRVAMTAAEPSVDMAVQLDGATLSTGLLGSVIPLDPGPHTLLVTAPGRAPWLDRFDAVAAQDVTRITIPALAKLAPVDDARPVPPSAATASTLRPPPLPANVSANGRAWERPLGFGLAGAGVVAFGLTTIYAATSISRANGADSAREAGNASLAGQYDDQATQLRNYALVAGGIGAAALGVGLYMIFAAPRGARAVSTISTEPSMRVVPSVSAQGGAIRVTITY